MTPAELKAFLDRKVSEYNRPSFIAADPVSVPHRFTQKADIEIAGFFAALFAWGNRTTIINKSNELMALMDEAPYQFVTQHEEQDLKRFLHFRHRTFNPTDILYFIQFFQQHYRQSNTLETAFVPGRFTGMEDALNSFHTYFFSLPDAPPRTRKHIAAPFKGSTCKRILMYLRWLVRADGQGVDFGLWKKIRPADLVIPVDLHVARVARRFGLLERPATDWTAALELTGRLKAFDPADPVKYDFALFSLGIGERF
ncbi:TIGR02757 family protein [Flaviaesturariibacter aridisoli]|uniref:TIGR02757 family protein n=1 Tax=Flaviaesturariibacter aridisoli TaxID=2545761 RepID=A0A4R4E1C6_9BACT|nr:TIGR02757 family protein [Flaviaesturariibacter aridisoli]TCZ68404.1 TIGR02757 family protein [Flaviaesturariibacter aridisoli]